MSARLKPHTLNDWTQAIANIFVALSVAFAAYQYYRARLDSRVDRSLEFVKRFEAVEFAPNREGAETLASKIRDALQSTLVDHRLNGLAKKERDDLRTRLELSIAYGTKNDPPAAIIEVVGYFGALQSCIDKSICDFGTAHAFLGTYAAAFWRDFDTVVAYERKHSRKNFGSEMERFVLQGVTYHG